VVVDGAGCRLPAPRQPAHREGDLLEQRPDRLGGLRPPEVVPLPPLDEALAVADVVLAEAARGGTGGAAT
jgi:hypothetical protein